MNLLEVAFPGHCFDTSIYFQCLQWISTLSLIILCYYSLEEAHPLVLSNYSQLGVWVPLQHCIPEVKPDTPTCRVCALDLWVILPVLWLELKVSGSHTNDYFFPFTLLLHKIWLLKNKYGCSLTAIPYPQNHLCFGDTEEKINPLSTPLNDMIKVIGNFILLIWG